MLPGMSRFAVLALLIACGNGSKPAADQAKTAPSGEEKIAVPGAKGGPAEGAIGAAGTDGSAATGAPAPDDPSKVSEATKQRSKDPKFNLQQPKEGTLTVGKVEAKAGAAATAEIKLAPGAGYHVATDYPIKVWLEAPSDVSVEKAYLTAGGRNKTQGDAATLSEENLTFAVKATPAKAGTYEIQGVFSFGICEKDSCHPRTQPITIQVAAK